METEQMNREAAWLSWSTTIFVGAKNCALRCGDIQGLCFGVAGSLRGRFFLSSISTSVHIPAASA